MTQHTAMVEVTLKPCPFCGDKAYRSHAGVIQCERCGACIANARAWNTRRAQPSITPPEPQSASNDAIRAQPKEGE